MSAIILRFPDMICSLGPRGAAVKATTVSGREMLSDSLGLPARRATEIDPAVLDSLLRRRPELLAYDVPQRGS